MNNKYPQNQTNQPVGSTHSDEPLFTYTHHTSPYNPLCQQTKDDRARIFVEAEKLAMPSKDSGWEESARVVKLSDLRDIIFRSW